MKPDRTQFPACKNCGGPIKPGQKTTTMKEPGKNLTSEFHANHTDCANESPKNFPSRGGNPLYDMRDWDYGN